MLAMVESIQLRIAATEVYTCARQVERPPSILLTDDHHIAASQAKYASHPGGAYAGAASRPLSISILFSSPRHNPRLHVSIGGLAVQDERAAAVSLARIRSATARAKRGFSNIRIIVGVANPAVFGADVGN